MPHRERPAPGPPPGLGERPEAREEPRHLRVHRGGREAVAHHHLHVGTRRAPASDGGSRRCREPPPQIGSQQVGRVVGGLGRNCEQPEVGHVDAREVERSVDRIASERVIGTQRERVGRAV